MYADISAKDAFSQHTNTLAILAGMIDGAPARDLALRILTEPGLAQTGLFFRFYVHQALAKVGEGDRYLDQLGDWRSMLDRGLTTFAEIVDHPGSPSRSDCHAWSASPNIEVFRTVLGVDSSSPAFRTVSVRPHLGKLTSVTGAVPHPKGMIQVRIQNGIPKVTLPAGVTGELVWGGKTWILAGDVQQPKA
jgi:alpha-L-rhamnosidase